MYVRIYHNFRHVLPGDIHGTEFLASSEPQEIDDSAAKIAIENAWAKPVQAKETASAETPKKQPAKTRSSKSK